MKYAIMTILAVTIVMVSVNPVFAEHDLPRDVPFASKTQSVCFDSASMNLLNVGGSTGHVLLMHHAATNAMNLLNSQTNMVLTIDNTCNSGDNLVGADNLRDDAQGVEWDRNQNTTTHHVEIFLNTDRTWSTTTTCGWFQDLNAEYVYNHEFGHFAGLGHTEKWYTSNSHSIMKPWCNSGYSTFSSADITQINGYYP